MLFSEFGMFLVIASMHTPPKNRDDCVLPCMGSCYKIFIKNGNVWETCPQPLGHHRACLFRERHWCSRKSSYRWKMRWSASGTVWRGVSLSSATPGDEDVFRGLNSWMVSARESRRSQARQVMWAMANEFTCECTKARQHRRQAAWPHFARAYRYSSPSSSSLAQTGQPPQATSRCTLKRPGKPSAGSSHKTDIAANPVLTLLAAEAVPVGRLRFLWGHLYLWRPVELEDEITDGAERALRWLPGRKNR